jgi:hypothetical protein
MSRRVFGVVILAAAIVFGAVWRFSSDVSQSAISISERARVGGSTGEQTVAVQSGASHQWDRGQPPSSDSVVDSESRPSTAFRRSQNETTPPSAASFEQQSIPDEKSEDSVAARAYVRGTPFPLSPSVSHTCSQMAHLGKASCADIYGLLDQMQNEPRDKEWAESMEQIIQHLVTNHPGYSVRALACRTTVCALEVESTLGVFRPDKRALSGKLSWIDQSYGYEVNNNTEKVKVTLVVFHRD